MEQSIIYVMAASGQPVMPTRRPNKVWYWLRKGLAEVVSREPFTIRLRFETTPYTQPVTVGIDTGSKTVGIAATSNREVVYQAEVHLRDDIGGKLRQPRQYRRNLRSRKTRYRPPGWLAPSLRSKAEASVKSVCFAARLLPVSLLHVEITSFDTQKMQNPDIQSLHYQQGELEGYLLREYVLHKWQRRCSYCGASHIPHQVQAHSGAELAQVAQQRRGSHRL